MNTGSHARSLLGVVALATWLTAFVAPAATAWRCQMGNRTMRHPCCPDRAERASQESGLAAVPCCAPVPQLAERAPLQVPARPECPEAPAVLAPEAQRLAVSAPGPSLATRWTRAEFDAGPPILRRVCSLLI